MARLSKTTQFSIYEDGIPKPDTTRQRSLDDTTHLGVEKEDVSEEQEDSASQTCYDGTDTTTLQAVQEQDQDENDADDERRQSSHTTASISSLPESAYETDNDLEILEYDPSTPSLIRPNLRRIQSLQRQQIKSAPLLGPGSPRRPLLSQSRSRNGTPKSARSYIFRGSPRPRKRISEATETPEEDQRVYPLVLLHVSLLPVDLPWSAESIQEILPARIVEDLQLIRSKISETVLSRGILISHPREEYELLEERLLEALELKEERVTKCGHFHGRQSSSESEVDTDTDSGVGSSVDGSDGEVCVTCKHHIKTSRTATGIGDRKWTVKVFAANGLLRASAWAAAWSDMESVDIEIVPWISEDTRRKLEERREREEAAAAKAAAEAAQEEVEERIRRIVEEEVWLAREDLKGQYEAERGIRRDGVSADAHYSTYVGEQVDNTELGEQDLQRDSPRTTSGDVPQVYRSSQIPISILLKNYIYLLAKDRRNVAICLLTVLTILFVLFATVTPKRPPLSRPPSAGVDILQQAELPASIQDKMAQVVYKSDNAASDEAILSSKPSNSSFSVIPDADMIDLRDDICVHDRYKWDFGASLNGDICPVA